MKLSREKRSRLAAREAKAVKEYKRAADPEWTPVAKPLTPREEDATRRLDEAQIDHAEAVAGDRAARSAEKAKAARRKASRR